MSKKILKTKAGALQQAVHVLAKSVDIKGEVEENAHVAFRKGREVRLYGTDRENFSTIRLPCQSSNFKPFMVPFNELQTFVNFWDAAESVVLTIDGGSVIITCGQDELELPMRQGVAEFFDKFPKAPTKGWSQVNNLPYALSIATPLADKKASHTFLHGPHVRVKDGFLTIEGSSATRLVQLKSKTNGKTPIDCTILKEGGELFSRLEGPGVLALSGSYLFYRCLLGTFVTLVLQGSAKFPDLEEMGQRKPDKAKAKLGKSEFNTLLQKVSGVGSDRFELHHPDSARKVVVKAGTLPQYRGDFPAKTTGKLPLIALDVNHMRYLLSFLPTSDLVLWFGGDRDSIWYQDEKEGITYIYISSPYVVSQTQQER